MTIHMATPEPIPRPRLNRLNKPLTLHPSHNKAHHRHPKLLLSRGLPDDCDPVIRDQELQQDGLQPLLMCDHARPRCSGIGPKVRHHGGDARRELVVSRGQVELMIECVGGFEEVCQRIDLVVDACGGVKLREVGAVYLVPGECLPSVSNRAS